MVGKRLEQAGDRRPVWLDQREISAATIEREVGVQRRIGTRAVFSRGENYQPRICLECHVRKLPQIQIGGRVGQVPAGQIRWRVARVVNLDPVGRFAIVIAQRTTGHGHKFADDRRGIKHLSLFERLEVEPARAERTSRRARGCRLFNHSDYDTGRAD